MGCDIYIYYRLYPAIDDELGEEVYDYQGVDVSRVFINEGCAGQVVQYPEGAIYTPAYADIVIPETIEGVPIKSIDYIYAEVNGTGWFSPTSFDIYIPQCIENTGEISASTYVVPATGSGCGRDFEIKLHYKGTCAQLLENGYSDEEFVCSDGTVSTERVMYDGTCAEWWSICPSKLADTIAYCSDGTVNAPFPKDDNYTFTREPKSAVYVGTPADDCIGLQIPNDKYGYPVTEIVADAAFLFLS